MGILFRVPPLLFVLLLPCSEGWLPSPPLSRATSAALGARRAYTLDVLTAKRPVKKGKGGGGGAPSTVKGFGSSTPAAPSGGSSQAIDLVRDRATLEFLEWLEKGGAQVAHLSIAKLGREKLRGVVALKPFKKGEVILSIPYELAIDVTGEGRPTTGPPDPVSAALELVRLVKAEALPKCYLALLPTPETPHYASTTDFFTPEELDLLQWPPVKEETEARLQRLNGLAEEKGVTVQDLKWAMWMVVSRSLGVQGNVGQRQLLIPFLDMCNHRASGRHILTGRAVPGGQLRILAGEDVEVGDEITFLYGAGMLDSPRLIQDYGFIDPESTLEADKRTVAAASEASLDALKASDLDADLKLLKQEEEGGAGFSIQTLALGFRIALKRAVESLKQSE